MLRIYKASQIPFFYLCSLIFVCSFAVFVSSCGEGGTCVEDKDCPGLTGVCTSGKCSEKTEDAGPKVVKTQECQDGHQRSCYSAPSSTIGVGPCKLGKQSCSKGQWGECVGEVGPAEKESCNDIDDNCNGLLDEGCPCKKGESRSCYSSAPSTKSTRPCQVGLQACEESGVWGEVCNGQYTPQAEVCNGIDDDCNGVIDDDCPCKKGSVRDCYLGPPETVGKGICKKGEMFCTEENKWGPCEKSTPPSKDLCNAKDDDCDGKIDEDCECSPGDSQTCYSGKDGTADVGECRSGLKTCSAEGRWEACAEEVVPKSESCNKKDDNCDGKVDEGCDCVDGSSRGCYTAQSGCTKSTVGFNCTGSCKAGIQTCKAGKWQSCQSQVLPSAKEQCDGVDDNCDGKTDEGCQCKPQSTQACGSDKGECKKGKQVCSAGGQWGPCQGATSASPELCDGLDNDCDGQVDELYPQLKQACSKGKGTCQSTGKFICTSDKKAVTCDAKPGITAAEVCDGKDNDCDGQIDEALSKPCYSGDPKTAGVGTCKKGASLCLNGKFSSCQNQVLPTQERCANKKDDDCDGQVDEFGGRALSFSGGSDRVEIPHHDRLNIQGNFTIEIWFFAEPLGKRPLAILINKHKAFDDANGYHLKIQGASAECGFSWWTLNDGGQLLFGPCPVRKWTHIALTYNSKTTDYQFFLNGKKTKTGKQKLAIGTNKYPLLLATESNTTGDPNFRGQIASFRISDSVRYTKDFKPTCIFSSDTNTVGVWNLDDGGGTSIKDLSPQKLQGKTIGARWATGRVCNASSKGGCVP